MVSPPCSGQLRSYRCVRIDVGKYVIMIVSRRLCCVVISYLSSYRQDPLQVSQRSLPSRYSAQVLDDYINIKYWGLTMTEAKLICHLLKIGVLDPTNWLRSLREQSQDRQDDDILFISMVKGTSKTTNRIQMDIITPSSTETTLP